jgi:uncharacterized membrane protein
MFLNFVVGAVLIAIALLVCYLVGLIASKIFDLSDHEMNIFVIMSFGVGIIIAVISCAAIAILCGETAMHYIHLG